MHNSAASRVGSDTGKKYANTGYGYFQYIRILKKNYGSFHPRMYLDTSIRILFSDTLTDTFTDTFKVAEENPIVQINNGKIRGTSMKTFNGNTFYAFQGIPYAEPPVGHLRFEPPQPAKNWEIILHSENADKICIQTSSSLLPDESEDCLYLNVYTPELPSEKQNVSLPVMVFIHGGAFVMGSNSINEYKPHKLMDYGIIMVAVQYRLGLLGFLSTGDLECPGNNGFKDQQFALRWVQENIRTFGGDPTKVTVTGQSAGAASVGYQLLGENAEGLFRGVIQASGSSLGAWTFQRDPRSIAFEVASYINPEIRENATTRELMELFRIANISEIKESCFNVFGGDSMGSFFSTFNGFVFAGVIEPEHSGAFLTESAFQKFENGNFNIVPTFIGITSEEALFIANQKIFREQIIEYDTSPEELVSPDMHIVDQYVKREVGNDIRRLYVGNGSLQEDVGSSVKYVSDGAFGKPNIKQAQLEAYYTDVYFYEFTYSGDLGRSGLPLTYLPGAETVSHGEDINYLFIKDLEEVEKYSEMDVITADRFALIWTNFVKYLNPTPEPDEILQNVILPKLSSPRFTYLLINETLEIQHDLKKSMRDKYQQLYELYAVPPLYTY